MDENISLWPGIINVKPQRAILKSHPWSSGTARDPSHLGLQLLLHAAVWVWMSVKTQSDDTCTVIILYYSIFLSFNDCLLQV